MVGDDVDVDGVDVDASVRLSLSSVSSTPASTHGADICRLKNANESAKPFLYSSGMLDNFAVVAIA